MADRITKCNIRIVDLQGVEIAYFENVVPKEISSKYEVCNQKYIANDTLEIECVTDNLMTKE